MNRDKALAFHVKKASGDEEFFSVEKLKTSLQNAGAEEDIIQYIINDIMSWIYNGATTSEIYSRAFSLLRQKRSHLASRYRLKKAIMELGPTGYPFEHFIGKILEIQGYSTEIGQIVQGHCVSHEVDVIATKGKEKFFIECKYGQNPGRTVNVQVPLYIRSRVYDIVKKQKESLQYSGFSFHGWVVTNTRFTSDAIAYGKCSGLHLLSWDFPEGNGLKDIIDLNKIYPVTVLNHLTKNQKQHLLEQGIVICSQLLKKPEYLEPLHLSQYEYRELIAELEEIS
jgi:hypothetical protein